VSTPPAARLPVESVDLRLVPSALAAWFGALVAVLASRAVVLAVGGTAVLGAGGLVVAALRGRGARPVGRGARPDGRAAAWGADRHLATAFLAIGVLLTVLVGGSVLGHGRSSGLLAEAVSEGATATVRGVVVGQPVEVDARWSSDQPHVRMVVEVRCVEARGRRGPAHATVEVLAPGAAASVGAVVEVTGRLRPADGAADRAAGALDAVRPVSVVAAPTGLTGWHATVTAGAGKVASRIGGDAGALLLGVAIGDTSRVDAGLAAAMRTAGLTHLTAVSGAHFAIVGSVVAAAAGACRLPRAGRAAAVLVAGALLFWLVGAQPSVLRAAVMGLIGVAGLLAGRPARAPAALSAAIVVLLVGDPWLATEVGFVLSVLATASIVLLGRAWVERWSARLGPGLAGALAVPLAAQLACGPVLLAIRPDVSSYAVLANLAVAPAVGPATVLGVLTAAVAPVWPSGALVMGHLAGAACWWIAVVARTVAAAPGADTAWAPGFVGILALAGAGVATTALLLRTGPPA